MGCHGLTEAVSRSRTVLGVRGRQPDEAGVQPPAGGVRGAAGGEAAHTSLSSVSLPVLSPTLSAGTSSLPSSDR